MKTKNRKKGTVMMFIGLLFLAAALFLTIYNLYEARRAEQASLSVLPNLKKEIEGEAKQLAEEYDFENEAVFYGDLGEMPVIIIAGKEYIGILEIPDLNLVLPVLKDWSEEGLRIAPCHYEGNLYQNNLVIAGHNYARHFSSIKKLEMGAEIIFTDGKNREFRYEVARTEVLGGNDVKEMIHGFWDLTLFTCTFNGEGRYAVRCIRKE